MDLSWYNTLNKPFFNPPAWIFGPAWAILYFLMAVSAIMVWRKGIKKEKVRKALKIFAIQLALNLSWSPIFFGAHNTLFALLIIIVMWVFIIKTIRVFAKVDKFASYLLYPYLLWVSFAAVLNFSVWVLNR